MRPYQIHRFNGADWIMAAAFDSETDVLNEYELLRKKIPEHRIRVAHISYLVVTILRDSEAEK